MDTFDFQAFFVFTLLPLVVTLALERFFIYKLGQSPALQAWCSKRRWLEPNMISLARCFMGFGSVLIYHYVGKVWGLYFFGFWIISDITDGSLARILNKKSSEGEVMDPLSDKFLYFPPLFYAAFLSYLSLNLVLLYLLSDAFGQIIRHFPFVKARHANLFGKGKTFLTTVLLCFIFLQDSYAEKMLFDINDLAVDHDHHTLSEQLSVSFDSELLVRQYFEPLQLSMRFGRHSALFFRLSFAVHLFARVCWPDS